MQIAPSKGRSTSILIAVFIFVFLGALYFKAESTASSPVTMAGEKDLAIYKVEVAEREAARVSKPATSTTDTPSDITE